MKLFVVALLLSGALAVSALDDVICTWNSANGKCEGPHPAYGVSYSPEASTKTGFDVKGARESQYICQQHSKKELVGARTWGALSINGRCTLEQRAVLHFALGSVATVTG